MKVVFWSFLLLALVACAVTQAPDQPNTITVKVDLTTAQRQAQAMADAANQWAASQAGSLSASSQQHLQTALAAMNAAVSAFVGLPAGQSPTAAQYAEVASRALMTVIPLLPIPAVAKIAFEAGLGVIEAFAASMTTITVPATTTVSLRRGGRPAVLQAPVPVPLP